MKILATVGANAAPMAIPVFSNIAKLKIVIE